MNEKLMSIYMNEIQVESPTKVFKTRWLDRSVAILFAVSFLALVLKDAGEALAEWVMK